MSASCPDNQTEAELLDVYGGESVALCHRWEKEGEWNDQITKASKSVSGLYVDLQGDKGGRAKHNEAQIRNHDADRQILLLHHVYRQHDAITHFSS